MKKASFILFKISTIFGAITGAIILACVPALLVCGFSTHIHEMLINAYNNGDLVWPPSNMQMDAETYASLMQIFTATTGFLFLALGLLYVVASIIAIRVRKETTRGLLIFSIVLGAFSLDTMVVGGIFGLIAFKKEQPQE